MPSSEGLRLKLCWSVWRQEGNPFGQNFLLYMVDFFYHGQLMQIHIQWYVLKIPSLHHEYDISQLMCQSYAFLTKRRFKKKLLENSNKRGGDSESRFYSTKKKTCAKNTWNCLKSILRQTCFFQLWPPLPPTQPCPDMSTDWLSEIKQRKAITWSVGIQKITHIIQNSFCGAYIIFRFLFFSPIRQ